MPNTLPDWLTYLESLHPKTIALGLERVAQVKQRLNLNPDFPIIIVGGTNGKGSTCAMLESILYAAGYKVGCYTSPHLLHYNERVRINKQAVSDAELCASFEKVEEARKSQTAFPPPLRGGAREGVETGRLLINVFTPIRACVVGASVPYNHGLPLAGTTFPLKRGRSAVPSFS
jgi:hypothetical protein